MTRTELFELLNTITPPDEDMRAAAHEHWASRAKPLGGLGELENIIEDAAALTGSIMPDIGLRTLFVLCADNGIVSHGVTQTDSSVTRAVAENLVLNRTSACCMARTADCRVVPVDMGIKGGTVEGTLNRRMGDGTADFTLGPAMSEEQLLNAIQAGILLVREEKARRTGLICTGEMGIGNTTTSSAVASVLLSESVEKMTGRGAGLSDEGLKRKCEVIRRGIEVNRPDKNDVLDTLAKLGGFDIAGMCGLFLGGAIECVPVIADGFISTVAALCAVKLCPMASKAIFASHLSGEGAAAIVLNALGKKPMINASMRLGEGTGAVASLPLWDMAMSVYRDCYSFTDGGIEQYTPQESRP